MLFRSGGVGPDGFLLVLGARYLAPPADAMPPEMLVRPVGALLAHPWSLRPQLGWRVPGDDSSPFARRERDGGLTPQDLLDALQLGDVPLLRGNVFGFVGDVAEARRIDAGLRQLFASLQPMSVHSRAAGDDGPALEFVQPCLADRASAAFVGGERAVLKDHEVEIAEASQLANPVIGIVRTGMWSTATAVASGNTWHVDGR